MIISASGARWTASSSVLALALDVLIPMISELETHEVVGALNEGNVGMLDVVVVGEGSGVDLVVCLDVGCALMQMITDVKLRI